MVKVKAKHTKSWYEKKLDEVFSQYIRLKYSDSNGYCKCISCGKIHYWKQIQNGHYMSRRYRSTRWCEDNCRPQDVSCNIFNQGNIQAYRVALVKEIGEQRVNLVEIRARQETCKYSIWELEELIKDYKQKVEQLKIDKHIQ